MSEKRYEIRDASGTLIAVHIRRDFIDDRGEPAKTFLWELPDRAPSLKSLGVPVESRSTRVYVQSGTRIAMLFCPECLSYNIAEGKRDFKRLSCRDCGAWWPGPLQYDAIMERGALSDTWPSDLWAELTKTAEDFEEKETPAGGPASSKSANGPGSEGRHG